MAKPASGVWGIDLGQCALKALRLQEVDGQLTATAFDYVEYPKILSQPDADPDQLTREALEQFLSRNTLKGDTVAIAVPGQSGLARFVKLPPVEEKKIADIVKFEAKQQIPFNLDEVVWDYQKLGAGEVVEGLALETEIGLFAMKRDMVNRYIQHFKDVKVEVHLIQMAPLALCNFIGYDLLGREPGAPAPEVKPGCVVGLDIGTDSSNLVVTDGGKVIWQRPIPLGGNHFTRAITKDLKLTFAKAEHLKRNAAKSGPTELKKILASLKPVLNDFVGEVQRSLGYFTNTHKDAQIEYMIGLGNAFRLPGLQRFLGEKLQLEVRKIDKMTRLSGEAVLSAPIYLENILSFGVAYGLCLQGLKRARLITNLLPPEIRLERLVRAKKPFAAGAAGLLLVGLGGAALGNYLSARPYIAPAVVAAVKRANEVVSRVKAAETKFQAAKTEAQKEEEAVKSIVAGQAERANWLRLLAYIGEAIPQPDGENLPPEVKKLYFEDTPINRKGAARVMRGRDAYNKFVDRLKEGFKPPADDGKEVDTLPEGIDDLVQYHIDSIDARFCDDLAEFWKKAKNTRDDGNVRPIEHAKKVPEGKGWVVEISGFTYHHDKETFIRRTLLENLARLGIKAEVKAAEGAPMPMGDMPPATPMPAAGAAGGAADSGKVDLDSTKEPIVNKVSHVLLADAQTTGDERAPFVIMQGGRLDELLSPTQAGPGGPGGAMMPGGGQVGMTGGVPGASGSGGGDPGQPTRSSWKPLNARLGGGTGAGGGQLGGSSRGPGGPGMFVPGRGAGRGPGGEGSSRPPGPMGPGPMVPGGNGPAAVPQLGHVRTEFIILFIWIEPTPSDGLRTSPGS